MKVDAVPVSDVLALQDQMMVFVRAFGLLHSERTPCGVAVPVSEAHAVAELARDPGLSQLELGRRLRLEKSTVSRLVRQLDTRGWLERNGDDRDGRMIRLSLTDKGREAAADLAEARSARFERVVAAIPPDQRSAVLSSLSVLVEAVHEQS
jgi:DNA-binding MarR family transcriptional regulator